MNKDLLLQIKRGDILRYTFSSMNGASFVRKVDFVDESDNSVEMVNPVQNGVSSKVTAKLEGNEKILNGQKALILAEQKINGVIHKVTKVRAPRGVIWSAY